MWSGNGGAQQAEGGKKSASKKKKKTTKTGRLSEVLEPEPELGPELGARGEEHQQEDEGDHSEFSVGSHQARARSTTSLDDHIANALVTREPVGRDGRQLVVGRRVKIEHGKHAGKEGELVMLDRSKAVVIVPERGHRDAKRSVLMASAQPQKTHWALSMLIPEQPRAEPQPELPRKRAVSALTGRPNRHARPRNSTSPSSRVVQSVQPGEPRPRWNSSTALPGTALAPETLARSETSEEWNKEEADERASSSSSQRGRSGRAERKHSRRGSNTSSSQTSQSLSARSVQLVQRGFASPSRNMDVTPCHDRVTHEVSGRVSGHHAWGSNGANSDNGLSLIGELARWSASSRELISLLQDFSAGESVPALEQAALQRESQTLATRILTAVNHSESFAEWLSTAASEPSPTLHDFGMASVTGATSAATAGAATGDSSNAISAAPLPDGLQHASPGTVTRKRQQTKKSRQAKAHSSSSHKHQSAIDGSDITTARSKTDSAAPRAEIVSPSRLSGIPGSKPVSPSAIAESLSGRVVESSVAPTPPPVTAVAAATAAFAAERRQTTTDAAVRSKKAFVKQKPLQKNSQGKVARRSKSASSPKRNVRSPRGTPVAIHTAGLGWDGHSPTGTSDKGQKLPPARKPPAAVLSAAAREHQQRKQAARAAGRLDRDKAKGLTMRQFQRLRVQQNAHLKPQRVQAQVQQALEVEAESSESAEFVISGDMSGWDALNAKNSNDDSYSNGDDAKAQQSELNRMDEDDENGTVVLEAHEEEMEAEIALVETDNDVEEGTVELVQAEELEEVEQSADVHYAGEDGPLPGSEDNSQAEFDAIRNVIEAGFESSDEEFSDEELSSDEEG